MRLSVWGSAGDLINKNAQSLLRPSVIALGWDKFTRSCRISYAGRSPSRHLDSIDETLHNWLNKGRIFWVLPPNASSLKNNIVWHLVMILPFPSPFLRSSKRFDQVFALYIGRWIQLGSIHTPDGNRDLDIFHWHLRCSSSINLVSLFHRFLSYCIIYAIYFYRFQYHRP